LRPKTPITNLDAEVDLTIKHSDRTRTNWVYQQTLQVSGQIFSDQTVRFPVTSSKGNQYIMVVYDYDSNHILAEPLKSHSEHEFVQAYTKLHTKLTARGLRPLLQKLDNECPAGLKKFMKQKEWIISSSRRMSITQMPPREPSASGKTILLVA
jgi:mRNA-degrading endonuclease HigB of HigAB toxin-antitoxin module